MKIILFFLVFLVNFTFVNSQSVANKDLVVGDSSLQINKSTIVILTGKVANQTNNTPLVGATISVDGFKYYDMTDQNGSYALELPCGKYRLSIRFVGMLSLTKKIVVHSGGVLNFSLQEGVTDLEEVVITARSPDENINQSLSGVTKFNLQEIKALPTFAGEVDILKSIQTLPGVSSVGEGSSGYNVRGGRSDQNLILLNGAPLFNASHALGFLSAFNQDVVSNFTLYKGNIPANLGGRASSVLEVNTRNGDFEKWKFRGGVGLATGRIMAEGPLIKNKTSLLAAGRFSYSDWLLQQASSPSVKNSSLNFSDFNLTLSHRFNQKSIVNINYYLSQDRFRFAQQFGFEWTNQLLSLEWRSRTDKKLSPATLFVYGDYKNTLLNPGGPDASKLDNGIKYLQFKETLSFNPNEKNSITGGFEITNYMTEPEKLRPYSESSIVVEKSVRKNKGIEMAVFANHDFKISNRISLNYGIRFSGYSQLGADTVFNYQENLPRTVGSIRDTMQYSSNQRIISYSGPEPRVSLKISLKKNQSVKLSYNRLRQNIHLISNSAAPTPVDLWQVSTQYLPPQIADNFSVGYFLNLKENKWETSIEGFYKDMQNLVEYKNFPSLYLNNHLETELLSGIGKSYGGELYIRKLKGKWTGWVSYTYSRSLVKVDGNSSEEKVNNGNWYASNFDRPGNLSLVLNRNYKGNSSLSFLLSYISGRPFTALESSYSANSTIVPVFSDRNKYNIPDYIRLDVAVTIGNVFRKIDDSLSISIYNLLGRENAYSVYYQIPPANFFIPRAYKLAILGSAFISVTYNFNF
jgi:CarboxypepD_reg-like domain/TonB-dependent Receptor Plug Domain